MNQHLTTLLNLLRQNQSLTEPERSAVENAVRELEQLGGLPSGRNDEHTMSAMLESCRLNLEQKSRMVEAQQRELTIEAALDRVRARTMAMQKSEELSDTSYLLFEQLKELGEVADQMSITTFDEEEGIMTLYSTIYGNKWETTGRIPLDKHSALRKVQKAWSEKEKFVVIDLSGEVLDDFNKFKMKYSTQYKSADDLPKDRWVMHYVFFSKGALVFSSHEPRPQETIHLLERFAGVFDMAYTRFLDLQRAEAQAREAQIEAGLERVRSRSMGMQRSEELKEVITIVYHQLIHLKIHLDHAGFVVDYSPRGDWHFWIADERDIPSKITHPYFESVWANQFIDAKEKGASLFATHLNFEEKNKFYNELLSYVPGLPEASKDFYLGCPALAATTVLFDNVSLYIENFAGIPYSEEENNILIRFGKVFQQTYTRFLDLQKAEAQAREAQIEAALERVRNRTNAMRQSDELAETAGVLFEQFVLLGIKPRRCVIGIIDQTIQSAKLWFTSSEGRIIPGADLVPLNEQPNLLDLYNAWQEGKEHFSFRIQGQQRVEWTSYMVDKVNMHLPEYSPESIDREMISREPAIFNNFFFSQGFVLLHTSEDLLQADIPRLKRFAGVFGQSYTRFLDLKNAEAQAREAQIEASLERVRSKAMAMHNSADLSATVSAVFGELQKLGIETIRTGVALYSEARPEPVYYASTTGKDDSELVATGSPRPSSHLCLAQQYEAWLGQKNYFPVLSGEELRSYYAAISLQPSGRTNDSKPFQHEEYGYYLAFSAGNFYVWSLKSYTTDEVDILARFKTIVDLTFRRYFDIEKAEAQARNAVKQASLDRIRGEIASMRTSEDLNRITPIIWRELRTLEVPFIRCGVFIVDERHERVQVYLTTPDGKSLGVLHLSFDVNELTRKTVEHWKKNIVHKEHWNKEEFIAWTKSMITIGEVQNAETYQGAAEPPESLDLHFVPFTQGMLYVGDVSPLTDEKLELVKTLADAFAIAYARYEDFRNLEDAKSKVELTLNALSATQAQLVQQEKLASLGQLTAGIAHEIRNPLNFVNNFSSISIELVDEVSEGIKRSSRGAATGDIPQLLTDIRTNLTRIVEHGARAESIVKSMLQHSRGGSGSMEPTDLNALIKEYVNLAFHGMRAGENPINVSVEFDLDATVGNLPLKAEDFSRVILNLCQNAFDAMNDKQNTPGKPETSRSYHPKLIARTLREKGRNVIQIEDNGPGIPDAIKDKVLHPFFTTKKGTRGTGLGLSISNDIVKAHGGEMSIGDNRHGGTTFTIVLPIEREK